jgi:hypothetical protein
MPAQPHESKRHATVRQPKSRESFGWAFLVVRKIAEHRCLSSQLSLDVRGWRPHSPTEELNVALNLVRQHPGCTV